eukprot:628780-Amphidinium_carterae.1
MTQVLRVMGEYDELNLANCAAAEVSFRRLQTIEFGYLDKVRESEGKQGSGSKLTYEEQSILS